VTPISNTVKVLLKFIVLVAPPTELRAQYCIITDTWRLRWLSEALGSVRPCE
jgi:hypothetical protein